MLVKLYELPPVEPLIQSFRKQEMVVRRARPFEITPVRAFVEKHFALAWADEISVGFANRPVSVFIAHREDEILGFGAYECTRRAFFGPTGVLERERGRGIGKVLLLACLHGLAEMGYAYGIIGGAGPTEFYASSVGAIEIPGSVPGIYADLLRRKQTTRKKTSKR
jgi:predicted N-acetyltransferase YhbS